MAERKNQSDIIESLGNLGDITKETLQETVSALEGGYDADQLTESIAMSAAFEEQYADELRKEIKDKERKTKKERRKTKRTLRKTKQTSGKVRRAARKTSPSRQQRRFRDSEAEALKIQSDINTQQAKLRRARLNAEMKKAAEINKAFEQQKATRLKERGTAGITDYERAVEQANRNLRRSMRPVRSMKGRGLVNRDILDQERLLKFQGTELKNTPRARRLASQAGGGEITPRRPLVGLTAAEEKLRTARMAETTRHSAYRRRFVKPVGQNIPQPLEDIFSRGIRKSKLPTKSTLRNFEGRAFSLERAGLRSPFFEEASRQRGRAPRRQFERRTYEAPERGKLRVKASTVELDANKLFAERTARARELFREIPPRSAAAGAGRIPPRTPMGGGAGGGGLPPYRSAGVGLFEGGSLGGGKGIKGRLQSVFEFTVAAKAINTAFQGLNKAMSTIKDTDTELTQLTKVLDLSTAGVERLKQSAVGIGKSFGQSIPQVLKSFKIFAQQGLNVEEIQKRAEAAALGANVTTLSQAETTEALTAGMKVFSQRLDDPIKMLDSLAKVESKNAVTAGDLSQALLKVGAVAGTVGVSFDELNSMVTVIQEATRKGGREIGTSMRFILRKMFSPSALKSMEDLGIKTTDSVGDLRSAFDILQDLSQIFPDLTKRQKLNIAQTAAGSRRYNDLIVLLDGFAKTGDVVTQSQESGGFAMERNQRIMSSLTKQLDKTSASFEALSLSVGADMAGPLKGALKVAQGLLNTLTEISNVKLSDIFGGVGGKRTTPFGGRPEFAAEEPGMDIGGILGTALSMGGLMLGGKALGAGGRAVGRFFGLRKAGKAFNVDPRALKGFLQQKAMAGGVTFDQLLGGLNKGGMAGPGMLDEAVNMAITASLGKDVATTGYRAGRKLFGAKAAETVGAFGAKDARMQKLYSQQRQAKMARAGSFRKKALKGVGAANLLVGGAGLATTAGLAMQRPEGQDMSTMEKVMAGIFGVQTLAGLASLAKGGGFAGMGGKLGGLFKGGENLIKGAGAGAGRFGLNFGKVFAGGEIAGGATGLGAMAARTLPALALAAPFAIGGIRRGGESAEEEAARTGVTGVLGKSQRTRDTARSLEKLTESYFDLGDRLNKATSREEISRLTKQQNETRQSLLQGLKDNSDYIGEELVYTRESGELALKNTNLLKNRGDLLSKVNKIQTVANSYLSDAKDQKAGIKLAKEFNELGAEGRSYLAALNKQTRGVVKTKFMGMETTGLVRGAGELMEDTIGPAILEGIGSIAGILPGETAAQFSKFAKETRTIEGLTSGTFRRNRFRLGDLTAEEKKQLAAGPGGAGAQQLNQLLAGLRERIASEMMSGDMRKVSSGAALEKSYQRLGGDAFRGLVAAVDKEAAKNLPQDRGAVQRIMSQRLAGQMMVPGLETAGPQEFVSIVADKLEQFRQEGSKAFGTIEKSTVDQAISMDTLKKELKPGAVIEQFDESGKKVTGVATVLSTEGGRINVAFRDLKDGADSAKVAFTEFSKVFSDGSGLVATMVDQIRRSADTRLDPETRAAGFAAGIIQPGAAGKKTFKPLAGFLSDLDNATAGAIELVGRGKDGRVGDIGSVNNVLKGLRTAAEKQASLQQDVQDEQVKVGSKTFKARSAEVNALGVFNKIVTSLGDAAKSAEQNLRNLGKARVAREVAKAFPTMLTGALKGFSGVLPVTLPKREEELTPMELAQRSNKALFERLYNAEQERGVQRENIQIFSSAADDLIQFINNLSGQNQDFLQGITPQDFSKRLAGTPAAELSDKLIGGLVDTGVFKTEGDKVVGSFIQGGDQTKKLDALVSEVRKIFSEKIGSIAADMSKNAPVMAADQKAARVATDLAELAVSAKQAAEELQNIRSMPDTSRVESALGQGPFGRLGSRAASMALIQARNERATGFPIDFSELNPFQAERERIRKLGSQRARSGLTKFFDLSGNQLPALSRNQRQRAMMAVDFREMLARREIARRPAEQELKVKSDASGRAIIGLEKLIRSGDLQPGSERQIKEFVSRLRKDFEQDPRSMISRGGKVEGFKTIEELPKFIENLGEKAKLDMLPQEEVQKEMANTLLDMRNNLGSEVAQGLTDDQTAKKYGYMLSEADKKGKTTKQQAEAIKSKLNDSKLATSSGQQSMIQVLGEIAQILSQCCNLNQKKSDSLQTTLATKSKDQKKQQQQESTEYRNMASRNEKYQQQQKEELQKQTSIIDEGKRTAKRKEAEAGVEKATEAVKAIAEGGYTSPESVMTGFELEDRMTRFSADEKVIPASPLSEEEKRKRRVARRKQRKGPRPKTVTEMSPEDLEVGVGDLPSPYKDALRPLFEERAREKKQIDLYQSSIDQIEKERKGRGISQQRYNQLERLKKYKKGREQKVSGLESKIIDIQHRGPEEFNKLAQIQELRDKLPEFDKKAIEQQNQIEKWAAMLQKSEKGILVPKPRGGSYTKEELGANLEAAKKARVTTISYRKGTVRQIDRLRGTEMPAPTPEELAARLEDEKKRVGGKRYTIYKPEREQKEFYNYKPPKVTDFGSIEEFITGNKPFKPSKPINPTNLMTQADVVGGQYVSKGMFDSGKGRTPVITNETLRQLQSGNMPKDLFRNVATGPNLAAVGVKPQIALPTTSVDKSPGQRKYINPKDPYDWKTGYTMDQLAGGDRYGGGWMNPRGGKVAGGIVPKPKGSVINMQQLTAGLPKPWEKPSFDGQSPAPHAQNTLVNKIARAETGNPDASMQAVETPQYKDPAKARRAAAPGSQTGVEESLRSKSPAQSQGIGVGDSLSTLAKACESASSSISALSQSASAAESSFGKVASGADGLSESLDGISSGANDLASAISQAAQKLSSAGDTAAAGAGSRSGPGTGAQPDVTRLLESLTEKVSKNDKEIQSLGELRRQKQDLDEAVQKSQELQAKVATGLKDLETADGRINQAQEAAKSAENGVKTLQQQVAKLEGRIADVQTEARTSTYQSISIA